MSNGSIQISNQSWGLTVLRVVTGIIFMAHGWQKLFQMGLHGTAGMFGTIGVPVPAVSSAIVTFVELLGGLALIIGLLTRWAAALNGFDMIVAILLVHLKNGLLKPGGFRAPVDHAGSVYCAGHAGGRARRQSMERWQTHVMFMWARASRSCQGAGAASPVQAQLGRGFFDPRRRGDLRPPART
jgi:putative oxidoreductase